jgi:Fe-S oxidoreductase
VERVADYQEIIELIRDSGGEYFKRCFQCGLCDTLCPWNRVRDFSMRKVVRQAFFGMTEIESEEIWLCSTCGRCPQQCPREVQQIESVVVLRKIATEYGVFPTSVKPIRAISASLVAEGNPLNEKRKDRSKWTEGLSVPRFEEGMDLLYFPGCYPSYDPRIKKVARATAEVLQAAEVEFGILGAKENCCGESIRKAGDEELFKRLARENIKTFIDSGVQRILVTSPHCYHTFKNEYTQFRVDFEVIHMAQLLARLLEEGRLSLAGSYPRKVAYHDPCYLGRHNGVYDEPRQVLRQVPGLELVELPESREDSLCCGGGGGRIWMETPRGQRFCDLRVQQALDVGAEVLVTACPYCITNFEDSRLNLEAEDRIEIKDLSEVVREALAAQE